MASSSTSSEFPFFQDGDVSIVMTGNRVLALHSHNLRQASHIFARQLNQFPGVKLTSSARKNGYRPFRFQLIRSEMEELGYFKRVPLLDNGKPQSESYALASSLDTLNAGSRDKDRYWEWLFRTFYRLPLKFDDSSLSSILSDCMGLTEAAESIEAVAHVREIVDLELLRQGDILWKAIANNPIAWSSLAYRLNSPSIYKEAVVHLVGKWRMMDEDEKIALGIETRALCQRKWNELDLACQVMELRILGHYPAFLLSTDDKARSRTSYANDIYMWMALCLFRQYFAQAISDGRSRLNGDGGWAFYSALAEGGSAYLHHDDLQAFHQTAPMSRKAQSVFVANVNLIKEDVKVFVKDVMNMNVHGSVQGQSGAVRWLTCAVIEKEDLPWEVSDVQQEEDEFETRHGEIFEDEVVLQGVDDVGEDQTME